MGETINKCDCVIEYLLSNPFTKMKLDEKIKYFKMAIPKPVLTLNQPAKKGQNNFIRHFRVQQYQSAKWLCGCHAKNSLFCWPCLLFSNEENVWNRIGYRDLKNLAKCLKIHSCSSMHLLSWKSMKKFAKHSHLLKQQSTGNITVSKAEKLDIELHNIKVEKERDIFKRLVKVVGVLLKLGFVVSDSDLKNVTSDWDPFEVVKLVANYDNDLKSLRIEKKSKMKEQFHQIITAFSSCMLKEIKREISESRYVMLIFDSVVDAVSKSYIATTFRYVKKNGTLVERFLHFTEWPKLVKSTDAFLHIFSVLNKFDCRSKLVAYTYDGNMVLPGEEAELKERIRKENRAIFIPYYGHKLSYVLTQAISTIPAVKIFFASLAMIAKLFSKPTASAALELRLMYSKPATYCDGLKWNDPIRRIEIVQTYKTDIIWVLNLIMEKPQDFTEDVLALASGSLVAMRDFDFNLLLTAVAPIFFRCDGLFQIFHARMNDPDFCGQKIKEIQSLLARLARNFGNVWVSTMESTPSAYSVKFNKIYKPNERLLQESYKNLYNEIFNLLTQTFMERFGDVPKRLFFCLLNQKMFKRHRFMFPPGSLASLTDHFLCLFHNEYLKNELVAIYSDPEFLSIYDFHGYLINQELEEVFPQTFRLSMFFETLAVESKPATSIPERIRNFLETGKNLDSFSLFVIERQLLDELLEEDNFIVQITDEFAEKADRKDLIYKSLSKDSTSASNPDSDNPGSNPSLFPTPSEINMEISEMNPTGPPNVEISVPGPSCDDSMDESSSYLTEESITCIHIPDNVVDYQALVINDRQESKVTPVLLHRLLETTVEKESNNLPQEHLTVDREESLKSLPKEPSTAGQSLFHSPILIKQEIVSSEDEL